MCDGLQEKGNNNGQWWAAQLLLALGGASRWGKFGLRQLSGMLVLVFARTELQVRVRNASCCWERGGRPAKGGGASSLALAICGVGGCSLGVNQSINHTCGCLSWTCGRSCPASNYPPL